MKDGSIITGLFLIAIVMMIVYPVYDIFQMKLRLEERVIDQQALIESQEETIIKLNNTNVLLQNYIMYREQKKRDNVFY